MELPILFIGDSNRPEFRDSAALLVEHGALSVTDIPSALKMARDEIDPAAVILAQSWPGQFSARELDALQRAAPLARIVVLLGPWLEGETRTGNPWPAMLRIYWHQAPARLGLELERIEQQENPTWSLPLTASDDERLLSSCDHHERIDPTDSPSTTVMAIYAQQRETAESLADVCRANGWNALWLRTLPAATPLHVSAILFDASSGTPHELSAIAKLQSIAPETPIVALLGFPRADDAQRLRAAGVAAILTKPFLAADLIWQVEQLLVSEGIR